MAQRGGATSKPTVSGQAKNVRLASIFLVIIGGMSLFFAQSATWISQTIFNQQSFTSISTGVLLSESSRDSLATIIVDKSLENRPTINHLVGSNLRSLVSGLLGTDFASNALTGITSKTYAYLTAPDREDIALDLTALKQPLTTVISTLEENGRPVKLEASQIPSSITLIDSDSFPDLSGYVRAALIANLFMWLTTILAFSVYVFLNRSSRVAHSLYIISLVAAIVAGVGLVTGPFVPPIISTYISAIPVRTIATDLVNAFLQPFYAQLMVMLFVAALLALGVRLRKAFSYAAKTLVQRLTIDKKS